MKIVVMSIGSFDTQYSDYHIMRDIIVGLLERGHEVDLIQKQYLDLPKYPHQFYTYLGNQLKVHNIRFEKKAKVDLKSRYIADLSYYLKACRLAKQQNPDKVFLQSNNTAFLPVFYSKHILKCPLIYNEQDIFPENALLAGILSEHSIVYVVAHFLQKYAYKNATVLSTISDDMRSTIVKRYDIPKEKVQVIYNWGHEELKAHSEAENTFLKKYPKKPGEFRVVYAGNLGKMQNVEIILEAASLMKDKDEISFFIIGNGVNEQKLKKIAQDNNLNNVTFVSMQPPEEVADLYSAADVNIIPLKKGLINAALPSKFADCLIAEKPIILSMDCGSQFVELCKKHGIYSNDADDPTELINTVLKIRNNAIKSDYYSLWSKHFKKSISTAEHCNAVERWGTI